MKVKRKGRKEKTLVKRRERISIGRRRMKENIVCKGKIKTNTYYRHIAN